VLGRAAVLPVKGKTQPIEVVELVSKRSASVVSGS
jgi:hypothetical protein